MFELWEHIIVKKNGIPGQIIDITEDSKGKLYIVECDIQGQRDDADYPGEWPLYDCRDKDMEKIEGIIY